jgi:hypothetical protein
MAAYPTEGNYVYSRVFSRNREKKGNTRIRGLFEKFIIAHPSQKFTLPYEARLRSNPFYSTPLHSPLFKTYFNIIFPFTLESTTGSLLLRFSSQNFVYLSYLRVSIGRWEYFNQRKRNNWGLNTNEENCSMRIFMISSPHQTCSCMKSRRMGWAGKCQACERTKLCQWFCWEN